MEALWYPRATAEQLCTAQAAWGHRSAQSAGIPCFGEAGAASPMQKSSEVTRTDTGHYMNRIELENGTEDPAQILATVLALKSK